MSLGLIVLLILHSSPVNIMQIYLGLVLKKLKNKFFILITFFMYKETFIFRLSFRNKSKVRI